MNKQNKHCPLWESLNKPFTAVFVALITTIFASALGLGSLGLFVIVFFGYWMAMSIS